MLGFVAVAGGAERLQVFQRILPTELQRQDVVDFEEAARAPTVPLHLYFVRASGASVIVFVQILEPFQARPVVGDRADLFITKILRNGIEINHRFSRNHPCRRCSPYWVRIYRLDQTLVRRRH